MTSKIKLVNRNKEFILSWLIFLFRTKDIWVIQTHIFCHQQWTKLSNKVSYSYIICLKKHHRKQIFILSFFCPPVENSQDTSFFIRQCTYCCLTCLTKCFSLLTVLCSQGLDVYLVYQDVSSFCRSRDKKTAH